MNPTRTFRHLSSLVIAVAGILAGAATAAAHHSTAMFDMQTAVAIEGTVREFLWTNPHTWIVVTVDGEEYGLEVMSPNYLGRNGWTKNTLKPGEVVTLQIHPLKDGRKGGFMVSVKFKDGTLLNNLPGRGD